MIIDDITKEIDKLNAKRDALLKDIFSTEGALQAFLYMRDRELAGAAPAADPAAVEEAV